MAHQIRKLMADQGDILKGVVEADETYVGPKFAGKRGLYGKTPIIGVLQRGGNVQAQVATDATRATLIANLKAKVKECSIVCTDDAPAYNTVSQEGFIHHRVNHTQKEYVRGIAHTNC